MKQPTLKIEKTEDARVTWGDYGQSNPRVGDWSYRIPAVYSVTGPTTGRTYRVTGSGTSFMQRSSWWYEVEGEPMLYKGGFATRASCLAAVAKLETATQ